MQSEIPDLWPAEVGRVQVITPLLILRHQAGLLRQRSMNLLEAEVTTESDSRGPLDVAHYLELVVPSLDRLQVRLLNVRHNKVRVYPAYIGANEEYAWDGESRANSQSEFVQKLGSLLSSPDLRATIESLLAQANEATGLTTTTTQSA